MSSVKGQSLQYYDLHHLIALAGNKGHGQPPKNSYYRTHTPGGNQTDLVLWEWGKGTLEVILITSLLPNFMILECKVEVPTSQSCE